MSDVALFDDMFIPDNLDLYREGLLCLRDEVPETLRIVVELQWWKERDERHIGMSSGDHAYMPFRDGIWFERVETWGGWEAKPKHLLPWHVLEQMVGSHPLRAGVVSWARSRTVLGSWGDLYRPHELWPHPELWHPSYIEGDRERPGYGERMKVWHDVQTILTESAL